MTNTTLTPVRTLRKAANAQPTKKCTGTCDECRTRKKAFKKTGRGTPLPVVTPDQPEVEQNETEQIDETGIEFANKPKKTNWRGCFVGTEDF